MCISKGSILRASDKDKKVLFEADVEEVFPEFVTDGGAIGSVAGEYKTLTYDFLFSHSLKAIQELSAKNDALEAKITALENA